MRTSRLMVQIQVTLHVSEWSARFRPPPLSLFAVLQVFQMIQEQLCDESTLDDAVNAAVIVYCRRKGRVDLDTEVHQYHSARTGRSPSRDQYSSRVVVPSDLWRPRPPLARFPRPDCLTAKRCDGLLRATRRAGTHGQGGLGFFVCAHSRPGSITVRRNGIWWRTAQYGR